MNVVAGSRIVTPAACSAASRSAAIIAVAAPAASPSSAARAARRGWRGSPRSGAAASRSGSLRTSSRLSGFSSSARVMCDSAAARSPLSEKATPSMYSAGSFSGSCCSAAVSSAIARSDLAGVDGERGGVDPLLGRLRRGVERRQLALADADVELRALVQLLLLGEAGDDGLERLGRLAVALGLQRLHAALVEGDRVGVRAALRRRRCRLGGLASGLGAGRA